MSSGALSIYEPIQVLTASGDFASTPVKKKRKIGRRASTLLLLPPTHTYAIGDINYYTIGYNGCKMLLHKQTVFSPRGS